MRRLLIEADPRGDAAIVERVDRLYAAARDRPVDPAERLARRRTIAEGMERLREADPERYDQILLRLRRYDAAPAALWPARSPPRLGDLYARRQKLRGARDR